MEKLQFQFLLIKLRAVPITNCLQSIVIDELTEVQKKMTEDRHGHKEKWRLLIGSDELQSEVLQSLPAYCPSRYCLFAILIVVIAILIVMKKGLKFEGLNEPEEHWKNEELNWSRDEPNEIEPRREGAIQYEMSDS